LLFYNIEQAAEYLGIPKKYLDNYSKVGDELQIIKQGRRKGFEKETLDNWSNQRNFCLVDLNRTDYLKCLEFAIRSFYAYRSTSDFGTAQQRDAGKFVSNFVIGKLGELAVKKFLKTRFDVDVSLDFSLREAVVGQDITEIALPRRGSRVFNPIRKRIAIKTSKMKNVWLVVAQNEVEDPTRTSDFYIFSRVDLYLNHFIRILKDHQALTNLSDIIPQFEIIQAEVCGFATKEELIAESPTDILPIQNQTIQMSYIKKSGKLNKSQNLWEQLINEL